MNDPFWNSIIRIETQKAIGLVLGCAVHLVDVQSEASGAEADGENEKVLRGHWLASMFG